MPGGQHTGAQTEPNTLLVVNALLLQDEPLSLREISRRTGVSRNTVKAIRDSPCLMVDPVLVAHIKKNVEDMWYVEMATDLAAITPEKREKASAYQLRGMAGIAHQNAIAAANKALGHQTLNFSVLIQNSYKNDPHRNGPKPLKAKTVKPVSNKRAEAVIDVKPLKPVSKNDAKPDNSSNWMFK